MKTGIGNRTFTSTNRFGSPFKGHQVFFDEKELDALNSNKKQRKPKCYTPSRASVKSPKSKISLKSPSTKTMQQSVHLSGRKLSRIEKNITKLFSDLCPEEASSVESSPLFKNRNGTKKVLNKSRFAQNLIRTNIDAVSITSQVFPIQILPGKIKRPQKQPKH